MNDWTWTGVSPLPGGWLGGRDWRDWRNWRRMFLLVDIGELEELEEWRRERFRGRRRKGRLLLETRG